MTDHAPRPITGGAGGGVRMAESRTAAIVGGCAKAGRPLGIAIADTADTALPAVDKAHDVLGFDATAGMTEMPNEVIPWIERAVADGRI